MFKMLQRISATIVERAWLALLGMSLIGLVLRVGIILMRKTYLKDFSGTDHGSIAQSLADGAGYLLLTAV